jgi:hypothetical protein
MRLAETPMLFDRQKLLLRLLHVLGGEAGSLDFQKLLFLYCQTQVAPPYDFVPYRFGAFSFTSYADRRRLVERGLLEADERIWKLSPAGRKTVDRLGGDLAPLSAALRPYRNLRGDALVAATYRTYPYHATKSEIAERVLGGDAVALMRIEAERSGAAGPLLATIGYEGRSVEGYLNLLLRNGMTVLCDVRRNPLSRKYGFSKKTLAHACNGVGVRYEHLPQLGIASEERRSLGGDMDYQVLFARYERQTLPAEQSALALIHGWVVNGERVALTCFERDHQRCHRHSVANALIKLTDTPYPLQHL